MEELVVKKGEEEEKMKRRKKLARKLKELVTKAQSLFAIGIFFHLLAISYFKAVIVYILRFQCQLNESQSIVSFHLFQASSYITAYFFGILMSYSPFATFFLSMSFYFLGGIAIGTALILIPIAPQLIPLTPYVMIFFGFAIGTYKATVPKVLNPTHKSMDSFLFCILLEMIIETLIIGISPLILLDNETYIFLGLYSLSFLAIASASIEPMNDPEHLTERSFKFVNVYNCTFYGLWKTFGSFFKEGLFKRSKKKEEEQKHWMYRSEKRFGTDLVEALIIKITLHKFYFWLGGIWIGVELKYSHWVFQSYLTDRRLAGFVLQPHQFLAISPLIACLFIPIGVYYIGPALKKTFLNTGLRQMVVGALIILFATALSWRVSLKLGDVATEFMEPDLQHTKVRIINGHFCPSRIVLYYPMDPNSTPVFIPKPAIEIAFALDHDEHHHDEHHHHPEMKLQRTDSFYYLKRLGSNLDGEVTLEAVGDSNDLTTFTLDVPKGLTRKEVDRSDVFLVRKEREGEPDGLKAEYILYEDLESKRHPQLLPGVRIFVMAKDNYVHVNVKKGNQLIFRSRGHSDPSDVIWLNVGDGRNLKVHVNNQVIMFNHSLGPGEMIDLIVKTEEEVAVKIVEAKPPLHLSFSAVLPQYILSTFGELLVGVIGIQYLLRVAPQRMKYYVVMDWYLTMGCANLVIILVNQFSSLLHSQMYHLTLIVGISYCFLIVMSIRF